MAAVRCRLRSGPLLDARASPVVADEANRDSFAQLVVDIFAKEPADRGEHVELAYQIQQC